MGNTTCSARGTFLPGWIDPKDKKFYYRLKPLHATHQPFLGEHEDVVIGKGDVLSHGFHILNESKRISKQIREQISASVWVKQAWGDGRFSFESLGE